MRVEKTAIFLSEFLRSINVAVMAPLITFIALSVLKESNTYLGLCNSFLSIGYLLFSYSSGKMTDKFCKKNLLKISVIIFCISLAMLLISYNFTNSLKYLWLFILIVISFSFTLYDIVLSGYIGCAFEKGSLVQINSIINSASSLGAIFGPLIFSTLLVSISFQWTVLGFMTIMILVYIIIKFYFKDSKNFLIVNEKKVANKTLIQNIAIIFKNRILTYIVFTTVLINLSFSVLYTVLPSHMLYDLNLQDTDILNVWSYVGIGQLIGALLTMFVKRLDVKTIIYLSIIMTVPIFLLNRNITYVVVILIIISLNISRSMGAIARKTLQQAFVEKESIGTIMGTISMITLGINTFGFIIGGIISDSFGINISIIVSVVLLFLANIFMLFLKNKNVQRV